VVSITSTVVNGRAKTEQLKDAGSAHMRGIWARLRTRRCEAFAAGKARLYL
jgi:hypothetical protein